MCHLNTTLVPLTRFKDCHVCIVNTKRRKGKRKIKQKSWGLLLYQASPSLQGDKRGSNLISRNMPAIIVYYCALRQQFRGFTHQRKGTNETHFCLINLLWRYNPQKNLLMVDLGSKYGILGYKLFAILQINWDLHVFKWACYLKNVDCQTKRCLGLSGFLEYLDFHTHTHIHTHTHTHPALQCDSIPNHCQYSCPVWHHSLKQCKSPLLSSPNQLLWHLPTEVSLCRQTDTRNLLSFVKV